ncbi:MULTISPECIES: flagellar motor switch protein FliY [unclassified Helicobacter]|uniref:flagellar motor switch protein FliY n=1 Tax=unclassified Helicobacter TaxID=2593540 RepID=UPI000CF1545B|nr:MULTISPECIES: flagellar motor switch protein FliY [unclassified Helicobacter]
MNDFIKLFIQEAISTIEGLTGSSPNIKEIKSIDLKQEKISPPYALTSIETSGDFHTSLAIATPVELATALADTMVGGEGNAKESMDDDDLDANKEINSNIFGALSTSLGSQKKLPKLSFSCKSIEFVTSDQDHQGYTKAYNFSFELNTISSHFWLLSSADLENNLTQEAPTAKETTTQEQAQTTSSLSSDEMKNIAMLLDVKLNVKVRIGQKRMLLKDVVSMDIGSVIELNQLANDPLEILIDDKVIAKGEVVIVDGNFGIQVTEIGTKRQRLEQLKGH